jgi:hypothetical protein
MKTIIETVEKIVGYEAFDGCRFADVEECKKYENSALSVAKAVATHHEVNWQYSDSVFYMPDCEGKVVVYNIDSADTLFSINQYLNLMNKENSMISNKYIGSQVALEFPAYDDYVYILGTKEEMIANYIERMEKLFGSKE